MHRRIVRPAIFRVQLQDFLVDAYELREALREHTEEPRTHVARRCVEDDNARTAGGRRHLVTDRAFEGHDRQLAQEAKIGTLAWRDLTVGDAATVREFYKSVVGWESQAVDMGGYSDFNMIAPGSGETVAGICHARGSNAKLPAQWLIYIVVADVDRSAKTCTEQGGQLLDGGRFCVIQDPAGAVCALYSP